MFHLLIKILNISITVKSRHFLKKRKDLADIDDKISSIFKN